MKTWVGTRELCLHDSAIESTEMPLNLGKQGSGLDERTGERLEQKKAEELLISFLVFYEHFY